MDFSLAPYRWRGKTYKTVTGVLRAASAAYPEHIFGNFSREAMCLRSRDGRELQFPRELVDGTWQIERDAV